MLQHNESTKTFFSASAYFLLSVFFTFIVFPVGGKIDMYLIQPWIDSTGQFFNRENWYLERLNHQIVKILLLRFILCFLASGLRHLK